MKYDKEIARAALDIGAIKLSTQEPFQWASGYFMPIYNDNRALLANFDHRMLVTRGLVDLINEHKAEFDFIAGTATAGISPAASLAWVLDKPLVMLHEQKAYGIRPLGLVVDPEADAIASTAPWAIPEGTWVANTAALPFMYVRQASKDHGLKQQIEGMPRHGQKVALIDFYRGNEIGAEGKSPSYGEKAEAALAEKGVRVINTFPGDIRSIFEEVDLRGVRVLEIEDLISTGGSSAKEGAQYRALGATVTHCFSIFSYQLDVARGEFAKHMPGAVIDSVLTYRTLLEEARGSGKIDAAGLEALQEWREDPFGWGERRGFPQVKKGK